MESPFFFSNDPWSAAARRRPSGRGTQRPLFYVADPLSAPRRYPPVRNNQPPESAPTRALEQAPTARPRVVSIPVHFVRSDAGTEPVGLIRPETSESDAAVNIQRVFRGHIVRKNIKMLSQVALEVEEIEGRLRANEARLRVDAKERLRMNEMLMAQLLRLDAVRWVREYRRKVIRKVIALQEFLDAISVQIEESPNSVNSQETAEMNSNCVSDSETSNDVVSNTISQDAICAVVEEACQETKDPISGTVDDGEDAEKKSDANVFDEGFKVQDPLACRNDSEEEEEEERMLEDEDFVVVAADKATCNPPADIHCQNVPGVEFTEQETMPEDPSRMTERIGNASTEASGVEEALKKVMAENERLQGLVAALCEWNAEQCSLMAGLADRVGSLELAVQRMKKKNKKARHTK